MEKLKKEKVSATAPDLHISSHLSVRKASGVCRGGFRQWMAGIRRVRNIGPEINRHDCGHLQEPIKSEDT